MLKMKTMEFDATSEKVDDAVNRFCEEHDVVSITPMMYIKECPQSIGYNHRTFSPKNVVRVTIIYKTE